MMIFKFKHHQVGYPSSKRSIHRTIQVLHGYEKASCWQEALLLLEATPYSATAVTFGTVSRQDGNGVARTGIWEFVTVHY